MDLNELKDFNASFYIDQAKEGYNRRHAVFRLFYTLKKTVKDEDIGPNTKQIIIKILTEVAKLPECEKDITRITHGDSNQLIDLIKDEVKTGSLSPVAKFVLLEIFGNLQMNEKLGKKVIGIKSGAPKDPIKRAAGERLAMLVLYYYEQTNILSSNRERSGAFTRAAEHAYKVDEPTEAQERVVKEAWDKHKKTARVKWKALSDRYALTGNKPVPKEDYELSSWIDGYLF